MRLTGKSSAHKARNLAYMRQAKRLLSSKLNTAASDIAVAVPACAAVDAKVDPAGTAPMVMAKGLMTSDGVLKQLAAMRARLEQLELENAAFRTGTDAIAARALVASSRVGWARASSHQAARGRAPPPAQSSAQLHAPVDHAGVLP